MTQKPENNLEFDFNRSFVKGNLKQGMKEIEASSGDLWMLNPHSIKIIPGYNVREHDDVWEERVEILTASMMAEGFKKDSPISVIVVREDDKNVTYLKRGHTRLEACIRAIQRGAPITAIPAVANQVEMSEEDMIADLVISNNGEKLTPFETAIVCKRLVRFIGDTAKIAAKLSLSPAYVEDLLLMIDGPFDIREYVRKRVITATFAIDMLKRHGSKALEVIEQSIARAKASNSKKVSSKHVAGAVIQKAVKKAAPQMRIVLTEVKSDPAFAHLSQETRTKIEAIFAALNEAEKVEEKMNSQGLLGNETSSAGEVPVAA